MSQVNYEFSEHENKLLSDVANRMKVFAALMIVSVLFSFAMPIAQVMNSGLVSVVAITAVVLAIVNTMIYVAIALYTIGAASSIKSVVSTQGNDLVHLMDALRSLKRLYGIQYWLIVALLLIFVLGFVISMVYVLAL